MFSLPMTHMCHKSYSHDGEERSTFLPPSTWSHYTSAHLSVPTPAENTLPATPWFFHSYPPNLPPLKTLSPARAGDVTPCLYTSLVSIQRPQQPVQVRQRFMRIYSTCLLHSVLLMWSPLLCWDQAYTCQPFCWTIEACVQRSVDLLVAHHFNSLNPMPILTS